MYRITTIRIPVPCFNSRHPRTLPSRPQIRGEKTNKYRTSTVPQYVNHSRSVKICRSDEPLENHGAIFRIEQVEREKRSSTRSIDTVGGCWNGVASDAFPTGSSRRGKKKGSRGWEARKGEKEGEKKKGQRKTSGMTLISSRKSTRPDGREKKRARVGCAVLHAK